MKSLMNTNSQSSNRNSIGQYKWWLYYSIIMLGIAIFAFGYLSGMVSPTRFDKFTERFFSLVPVSSFSYTVAGAGVNASGSMIIVNWVVYATHFTFGFLFKNHAIVTVFWLLLLVVSTAANLLSVF